MAVQISGSAIEQFGKKLETFSNGLSDEERTLFKGMLQRGGGLSDHELSQATGGGSFAVQALQFDAFAPRLQASFFTRMMCWD
jgi:hypothetical protein